MCLHPIIFSPDAHVLVITKPHVNLFRKSKTSDASSGLTDREVNIVGLRLIYHNMGYINSFSMIRNNCETVMQRIKS